MKKVLIVLFLSFMFITNVKAEDLGLTESAKSSILIEASTGEIIHESNANERYAPASMTKSLILIMEELEKGNLSLDEKVKVSATAASMGGSQIYLEAGEEMTVNDLLKAICVGSANDAVVTLAERISGTEEAFVFKMNEKVKSMGLKNTNFKNATGLDTANHYSSAYDMASMARELVRHKKILEYSGIYETYLRQNTKNKFWLVNTNKLVRFYSGADGLKTGFTDAAGYTMAGTAERDNMRLIAIVLGEASGKARNQDATDLLDYGFNTYKVDLLNKKNEVVKELEIEKGNKSKVNAILKHDVSILRKKSDAGINYDTSVKINDIKLPLKKGDVVGKLEVLDNGNVIKSEDLIIDEDVSKINYFKHLYNSFKNIISGNFI